MNRMRSQAKAASSIKTRSVHVTTNSNVVDVNNPPVSPNSNKIVVDKKPVGGRPVGATN